MVKYVIKTEYDTFINVSTVDGSIYGCVCSLEKAQQYTEQEVLNIKTNFKKYWQDNGLKSYVLKLSI